MDSDAIYLMEMYNMHKDIYRSEMIKERLRGDRFDRYSYSAWAIQEFTNAVCDYEGMITPNELKMFLESELKRYEDYYKDEPKQIRYKYMYEALYELYKITRGYCDD